MRTINLSDTQTNLRALIDEVKDAGVTVITRGELPDAVMMSFEHYSGLMETLYLLSSPANAAHLNESLSQISTGDVQQRDLIDIVDR